MKANILLIDDEESVLEEVQEALEDNDYAVDVARNKDQALKMLAANHDRYDVIVQDYILENKARGHELLRSIAIKYPGLKVILYTGIDPVTVRQEAPSAYAIKVKPLNYPDLFSTIDDLVEQKDSYDDIARDFKQLLNADFCLVWKLNRRLDRFEITGYSDNLLDKSELKRTLDHVSENSLFKKLLIKKVPIYISSVRNAAKQGRFLHSDVAERYKGGSLISTPLIHDKHLLGMVDAYTKYPRQFDNDKLSADMRRNLTIYGKQAAESIRVAEQLERAQVLRDINQSIADNLDLDRLIEQILEKALILVDSTSGSIYLRDFLQNQLKLQHLSSSAEYNLPHVVQLGDGIVGEAAKQGSSIMRNVGVDSNSIIGEAIQTEIAVPIRRLDQSIGVMLLGSELSDGYNSDDIDILSGLATSAAISIEKANLLLQQQELSRIALNAKKPDELYRAVVKAAKTLTGADATLWRVTRDENQAKSLLKIMAAQGVIENDFDYLKNELTLIPNDSISAASLQAGEIIIRGDLLNDQETPRMAFLGKAGECGWRSFLVAPLLGRDREKLGVLSLYGLQPNQFGKPHKKLIESFVNQVSIAIQQQDQANALHQLSQIGSQLTGQIARSPKQILELTAREGRKLTGANIVVIFPYDYRRNSYFDSGMIITSGLDRAELSNMNKPRDNGLAKLIEETNGIVVEKISPDGIRIGLDQLENHNEEQIQLVINKIHESNFIRNKKIISFIGVPLRSSETSESLGIVYFDFFEEQLFVEQKLQRIRLFANQAAAILQSARLHKNTERINTELEQINKASLAIFEKETLQERLEAIIRSAISALRIDGNQSGGKVYRLNPDRKSLTLASFVGIDPKLLTVGDELKFGEGAAGHVALTKEAVIQNDYPNWDHRVHKLENEVQAAIEVPLIVNDELLGILAVIHKEKDWEFREEYDLPILNRLGSTAALAIRNAELFEQQERRATELEIINKFARLINSNVDALPGDFFSEILENVSRWIECTHCSIFLHDENDRDILRLTGTFPKEFVRPTNHLTYFEREKGLAGWVYANNHSLNIGDAWADGRFVPGGDPIKHPRSIILAPITEGHTVVGVLTADKNELDSFSNYDLNLLQSIAQHIGIGFTKSQLYNKINQQRKEQATAIERISTSFKEAESEEELYDQITTLCWQLFSKSDFVDFWLYDLQLDSLVCKSMKKREDVSLINLDKPIHISNGIIGRVARSLIYSYIPDVSDEADTYICLHADGHITGCQLAAPVAVENKLYGVLNIEHPNENAFNHEHINLINAVANLLSVAVENRRLISNRELQITRLQDLQKVSTKLLGYKRDPNEVLTQIVNSIQAFFPDSTCTIRTYDREHDLFEEPVFSKDSNLKGVFSKPRLNGKGITRHAVECRAPYFIPNVKRHDVKNGPNIKKDIRDQGIEAGISYPLFRQDTLLGNLYIYLPYSHEVSPTEKTLLDLFADQAITALGNSESNQNLINGISQISASISLEEEQSQKVFLEKIIESGAFLFDRADLFQVWVLSPDEKSLKVEAQKDVKGRSIKQLEVSEDKGVVWEAVKKRKPILIFDISKEPKYVGGAEQGSELTVPIFQKQKQKIFGVLNIEIESPNAFGDYDVKLAETISGLITVALENTKEIAHSRRQALQANEVSRFGILSGQILHKLNQTLANVPAELSRVETKLEQGDRGQEAAIEIIDLARKNLLHMAGNIQEMERKYNITKYQNSDSIFVNALVTELAQQHQNDLMIVDLASNLPAVTANKDSLRMVLENLLTNAKDAIKSKADGKILIRTKKSDKQIQILVIDNGTGILKENQDNIFELGFSTKSNGWGIGLYLDQYYIRSLGGEITFDSEEGKGTTFYIAIPTYGEHLHDSKNFNR